MYMTDPFQFSAAGFRLAGMMVETQMRVMFVLTDATFGGKNPFMHPPVTRRDAEETITPKVKKTAAPKIARVVKSTPKPSKVVKAKRPRKSTLPPSLQISEMPAHPAE